MKFILDNIYLIAIAVGLVMTFIANRTRFGRYVYAAGGNPEAVELAGINSRKLTVMVSGSALMCVVVWALKKLPTAPCSTPASRR